MRAADYFPTKIYGANGAQTQPLSTLNHKSPLCVGAMENGKDKPSISTRAVVDAATSVCECVFLVVTQQLGSYFRVIILGRQKSLKK